MKRYILDSGIVNDLINHRNGVDGNAAIVVKQGGRIGVRTPVLGELLAGLHNSSSRRKNEARLERFLARVALWAFDETAAREYGPIARDLRSRGIAIQQIGLVQKGSKKGNSVLVFVVRALARAGQPFYRVSPARTKARTTKCVLACFEPGQQIDMQIAAIAFALGNCVVVSKDGDFTNIKGLAVENWAQP